VGQCLRDRSRHCLRTRLLTEHPEKIGPNLAREISAFANTEGGTIIIGIQERKEGKSKVPVAQSIDDGVDGGLIGRDRLQRMIEGNVSPYLPGIRVLRVDLPNGTPQRCLYVIEVPQGSTAYQASDHIYYGRSEFEVKALPDHEVRIRMIRTQVALARLEVSGMSINKDREFNPKYKNDPSLVSGPDRDAYGDGYRFSLQVTNCGLLTVHDFFLEIEAQGALRGQIMGAGGWRFFEESIDPIADGTIRSRPKIFPEQHTAFPLEKVTLWVPRGEAIRQSEAILKWTIYLDNSPPCSGMLDLFDQVTSALS
jgi:hypothetical protein